MPRTLRLLSVFLLWIAALSCGDNVVFGPPTALVLSQTEAELEVNDTVTVTAVHKFSDRDDESATEVTWTSSDPSVVSIGMSADNSITLLAVKPGTATVTASSFDLDASIAITVNDKVLLGIALSPPTPSVAKGLTQQMHVVATYSDDSTEDVTATATWSVDHPELGPVTNQGVITAVSPGDVFVTAKFAGFEASTRVFITTAKLLNIVVTPVLPTVAKGLTVQLAATGLLSDGTTSNVTNAATWTSGTDTTASVSNTAGTKGKATGNAVGAAVITATVGTVSGSQSLTVTGAVITSISVTTQSGTVPLGIDPQFTATATLSDNTPLDVTTTATWSSSATAVATISSTGKAETLTTGGTTIKAQVGTIFGAFNLTVNNATLTAITVTATSLSVPNGVDPQFTARGAFSDGGDLDITADVLWTSSALAVATISNTTPGDGLATTLSVGSTIIKAELGVVSDSKTLQVTAAIVASIVVTHVGTGDLPKGLTRQFAAKAVLTDDSEQIVTTQAVWDTSVDTIAEVSNAAGSNGLVTGLLAGNVSVTASFGGKVGLEALVVGAPVLASITISPDPATAFLAEDVQFTALGKLSDNSDLDVTSTVTWSAVGTSTIDAAGVADAVATGSTTITATGTSVLGKITDTATLTVGGLAPIPTTDFIPVNEYATVASGGTFGGTPCINGVQFSQSSNFLHVCSANGYFRATVNTTTNVFTFPTQTTVANTAGVALATHQFGNNTALMYIASSSAGSNWFRSQNTGTSFTATNLTDPTGMTSVQLFAGRFQPGGTIGNFLGGHDPTNGGHAVIHFGTGMVPTNKVTIDATISGTTRSLGSTTFPDTNTLWIGVLGETPSGAAATGGVFESTNGTTWTNRTANINAIDAKLIHSVVVDPSAPSVSGHTIYLGLKGGSRVLKTGNAPADTTGIDPTWVAAAGPQDDVTKRIPPKAKVVQLFMSPQDAFTLFAATDLGLYKTIDAGATWTLAGFLGRNVRGVVQSTANSSVVVVGVDDAIGLYRTP